jgi:methionyl aminopeptidase
MIIKKNKQQIEGIRKSCKLAAKCLEYIKPFVKSGISTNYLNNKLSNFIKKNKAIPAPLNYCGFPKETCISLNEVVCHGIPSDSTILRDGDILNIDVTVILDGYFGDTSKMFSVGEISQEAKDLIDITEKSLYEGIKVIKPDIAFNNIGFAITNFLKNTKYSIVDKFVGHGCGIKFHEDPKICHYVDKKFKDFGKKIEPGMIFTIEPMINLGQAECVILEDKWTAVTADKKLSAQFEHMVLCTENGYEILTEVNC